MQKVSRAKSTGGQKKSALSSDTGLVQFQPGQSESNHIHKLYQDEMAIKNSHAPSKIFTKKSLIVSHMSHEKEIVFIYGVSLKGSNSKSEYQIPEIILKKA